jgi:hypothetical protein
MVKQWLKLTMMMARSRRCGDTRLGPPDEVGGCGTEAKDDAHRHLYPRLPGLRPGECDFLRGLRVMLRAGLILADAGTLLATRISPPPPPQ